MREAVHPARVARTGQSAAARRSGLAGVARLVVRDIHLALALALSVPVLMVAGSRPVDSVDVIGIMAALASAQVVMSALGRRRRTTLRRRWGWVVARGLVTMSAIAAAQMVVGAPGLLSTAYLPVVGVVAARGRRQAVSIVSLAVALQLTAEISERMVVSEVAFRTIGFAAVAVIVAFASQRQISRLQEARDRLCRAMTDDQRRARQIASVEAIGGILATSGPSPVALADVVERIARELGYRYVSIYLADGDVVRLGAQHGYVDLVEEFDGSRGIVGRVMRTRRAAFVPDVTADPDYWGLNPSVRSEICTPFMADGEFLGFINIESTADAPLDTADLRVLVAIADRLAAAMVIGRERQRLAERADLFRHLNGFSEAINATLDAEELYAAIARAATNVVPAAVVALTLLDRASGRYFIRAAVRRDGSVASDLGEIEVRPGKGMAGRAIRQRTLILDDSFDPKISPSITEIHPHPGPMRAAAVPLLRDGAALGALTLLRSPEDSPFGALDQDALAMLAGQATLAVSNAFLHAEVADLAVRDPLTGLFNRRYLDPALDQLFARRARAPEQERVPLAAIMFDLDNFSDLNNRYGHQVGDEVLRAFGSLLGSRMRATDLVARIGGEEFAAILFRATLDDATRVAEEVRAQFARMPVTLPDGTRLTATVSAGCAALSAEIESADALLRVADVALYMAKRAGRDRVVAA